jgi:hypothetical protein
VGLVGYVKKSLTGLPFVVKTHVQQTRHGRNAPLTRQEAAAGAIRSLTTEGTEATEAGRKGFRIPIRTLLSFPSVSVISVLSVVKSSVLLRSLDDKPNVEAIQVHHLVPRRHEVLDELLLRVRAAIDFR